MFPPPPCPLHSSFFGSNWIKINNQARKHLENVKPLVDAGKVIIGGMYLFSPISLIKYSIMSGFANISLLLSGAMLNVHPSEGETPSFKGSMLICVTETAEQAWEIIRNDIYVKAGVWDLDAAQVIPVCFFPSFPCLVVAVLLGLLTKDVVQICGQDWVVVKIGVFLFGMRW